MLSVTENAVLADLVLIIEGSEFAFKSCVYLRCIQCHQGRAPWKFRTYPNEKDETIFPAV